MSVDDADAAASVNAAAAAAARNVIIGWRGNEEEKQAEANFIVFFRSFGTVDFIIMPINARNDCNSLFFDDFMVIAMHSMNYCNSFLDTFMVTIKPV